MGDCKYCGKPAGIFRDKHVECEEAEIQRQLVTEAGRNKIVSEVQQIIVDSGNWGNLEMAIAEIEQSSCVPLSERKALLVKGWEKSLEHYVEDGILDVSEEKRLMEFKEHFALSQSDLDANGAMTKIVKAAVLRDILTGVIPQRVSFDGNLPINLQKGEQVVWAFSGAKYLEDKTRRQYVGGSQGLSFRLMKGVYYRVGAFKGQAVENTERVHVDTGLVVVTTKNIYFAGPKKSLRIPYPKIVSFEPFSDGVGVMRDATTAKPQLFVTGDGWFTYNLVSNLSQI